MVPIIACCGILLLKLLLVWRININWDEFNFLSHIHELARGELRLFLQGAYTHLFLWLTLLDSNEVGQIVVARIVMLGLLAATALLIWKLASLWTSPQAALLAPLCYLSMSPVLMYGASFRFDSLLTPLSLLTLLMLARQPLQKRSITAAGICLGVSVAITIKAILFAPAIVALIATSRVAERPWSARAVFWSLCHFGLIAVFIAAVLLFAHQLSLADGPTGSAGSFAMSAWSKAILETPLFARRSVLETTLNADTLAWMMVLAGFICALTIKRYRRSAACALALMPIAFYRNAWPYYYAVMLAPASILVSVAADSLRDLLNHRGSKKTADFVVIALTAALLSKAAINSEDLLYDRQVGQRAVIDAVHEIFPRPIPYIDHSGMIATFRKVNFFMSSWGIDNYRLKGEGFMRDTLTRYRPPLLLANQTVLIPGSPHFNRLLPEDRDLIEKSYVKYWGPIYVAGVRNTPRHGTDYGSMRVPFPGSYRVEATCPVVIDGAEKMNGDILEIADETQALAVRISGPTCAANRVGLIWAAAAAPPSITPPRVVLYTKL